MNKNNKLYTYYIFLILIFFYNLFLTYLNYLPSNFFVGDGLTYKELSEKLFYEFKYYENFPEEYPYRSWRTPGYPIFLFLLKFLSLALFLASWLGLLRPHFHIYYLMILLDFLSTRLLSSLPCLNEWYACKLSLSLLLLLYF